MQTLQGRMKYLRNGEAFACVVMPAVFYFKWERAAEPVAWGMRTAALIFVCYILLQGILYWQLKLQTVVQRQPLPAYFQPLYRFFKYSNFFAIAAVAAFIAATSATATQADLIWSCSLLALGVLEQINYYHYQLMYDTRAAWGYLRRNRKLRRAALGVDLER